MLAIPGGAALTSGSATAKTTGGSGVTVQTFNSGGSAADLDSFSVAVLC